MQLITRYGSGTHHAVAATAAVELPSIAEDMDSRIHRLLVGLVVQW